MATDQLLLILNLAQLESDNVRVWLLPLCVCKSHACRHLLLQVLSAQDAPQVIPLLTMNICVVPSFGLLKQHSHVMLFDGHIPQGGVAGLPDRHLLKILFSWMIPGGSTGLR